MVHSVLHDTIANYWNVYVEFLYLWDPWSDVQESLMPQPECV